MRAEDSPLSPYPEPRARERELEALLVQLGQRRRGVELVEYGRSVEGRALQAVRIPTPRGTSSAVPRVLICANTHGPEFIGNRIATQVIALLAGEDQPPPLSGLVELCELWIAPCLNPDGYARTCAREGRGKLSELRHNHRGVDLNRNWPLPPGGRRLPFPGAGSPHPEDATYRGPHPLSEPETAALDSMLAREDFHASANLHSFMGTLFPALVRRGQDFAHYRRLCRALSQAQAHTPYRRIASRMFDTFTGEQEDHQHHNRRCWSVCVESFPLFASLRQKRAQPSDALFWRFNPRDPREWVNNDLPGIAAFLHAAAQLPRPSARGELGRPTANHSAE